MERCRAGGKQALDQFLEMRRREGDRLKQDITQKLAVLAEHVAAVEEQSPKTVAAYRQRLLQKMEELLADRCIDQQRILMEAGLYAEKIAVDEETVRLKSHLDQFAQMMEQAGPVGRKLDFLVQEINRETNTIGSKAQDLAVTRRVVEMKSEIERSGNRSRISSRRKAMQLISIGHGNVVNARRVIAIVSPDSAPIKRMIQEAGIRAC